MGKILRAVTTIIMVIYLAACGEPNSSGNAIDVIIAPASDKSRNYINVSIDEIKILENDKDPIGKGEFQLIVIATDELGASGGQFCPAGAPIPIEVGSVIHSPCPFELSFIESEIGDEIYLVIMGVDIDESSTGVDIISDAAITGLAHGIGKLAKTGKLVVKAGTISSGGGLLLDLIVSAVGGQVKKWIEERDVIGIQAIQLRRRNGWNAGKSLTFTTADEGMRVKMSVSQSSKPGQVIASSKTENLSQNPTTPTKKPDNQQSAIPDPVDAITNYYQLINDGKYKKAWGKLTNNFISEHNITGFNPYRDWWLTVDEVRILSIDIISESSSKATLNVELSYYYTNGNIDTYDLTRFELVYDSSSGEWKINDTDLIKGTR